MFKAAAIRLTIWYLTLIMLLSLAFSIILYRFASSELTQNQTRQDSTLRHNFMLEEMPGFNAFNQARQDDLQKSQDNVRNDLIYFNIVILLTGGFLSYYLAIRTLKPIEEAVEAQNRFTADASHELRTPLTAIRTEIEVLLRDKNINLKESLESHKSTLEEVTRLEALSEGLLKLARQEINRKVIEFEPVKVTDIIDEAIKSRNSLAQSRNIEIKSEYNLNAQNPDTLLIDTEKWSLVESLTILIDNAIKYSPENSEILIYITKENHDHHLRISVKDKGIGIKASDLEHIFDRFYRADHSRSKNNIQGYGLGLAIANKIIKAHNGEIKVVSKPGKGSIFSVILPFKKKINI